MHTVLKTYYTVEAGHNEQRRNNNSMKSGASARPNAKPPEKGSFPLDHGGECKAHARTFMACLEAHSHRHAPCKSLAKVYFECRMDRDLMAKEDLGTMGFSEHQLHLNEVAAAATDRLETARKALKKNGYVAGLRAKGFLKEEKEDQGAATAAAAAGSSADAAGNAAKKSVVPSHLRQGARRDGLFGERR